MLNSHQILKGARTKGGIKTYVDAEYVGSPSFGTNTATVLDLVGQVAFDGVTFSLGAIDFSSLGLNTVLVDGDYVLSAVPAYAEPVDRTAAEAASLNYYVETNSSNNESVLHYFIPAAVEAEMAAAGGYSNVYKAVAMGSATSAQQLLFNRYSDFLERLSDIRYSGQLLEPVGVSYVCTRVFPQSNKSKLDALLGLTNQQIEEFKATQGYIPATRKVGAAPVQATAYNGILAKVQRAFGYTSLNNANADINPVEIRLNYKTGDNLSTPVDLDGDAITPTHIAVFELYQPTYMTSGHEGNEFGVFDLYEKGDALGLGRINPIYLARDIEIARSSAGRGAPLSALTKYAAPLPVARFTKADGPVISNATLYTASKLDLV